MSDDILKEARELAEGIDFKSLWIDDCGDKNQNLSCREFLVALVNAWPELAQRESPSATWDRCAERAALWMERNVTPGVYGHGLAGSLRIFLTGHYEPPTGEKE